MANSIQYNHKWYKILYCNNSIASSKSITAVIYIEEIYRSIQPSTIVVYYNGKYYHSNNFNIISMVLSFEHSLRTEIKITNLVDITREHNINIILDDQNNKS